MASRLALGALLGRGRGGRPPALGEGPPALGQLGGDGLRGGRVADEPGDLFALVLLTRKDHDPAYALIDGRLDRGGWVVEDDGGQAVLVPLEL